MLLRRHRERNQVVEKPEETPEKTIDEMTVAELKAYAEAHGYDLNAATRKADILERIKAIELADEKPEADKEVEPTGEETDGKEADKEVEPTDGEPNEGEETDNEEANPTGEV